MTILVGLALLVIAIAAYFLPTIVAGRREHPNKLAILVTNILLGWTFLGWCVAMIWACTGENRRQPRLSDNDWARQQRLADIERGSRRL